MNLYSLKKASYVCIFYFLTIVLFLPGLAGAEQTLQKETRVPVPGKILFIIIDGLEEKILNKGNAPNITALEQSGFKVKEVHPALPDRTRSVVATLLTGTEPAEHGYIEQEDTLHTTTLIEEFEGKGYKTAFFDGSGGTLETVGKKCSYLIKDNFNQKDHQVVDQVIHELGKKNEIYFSLILLPQLKAASDQYGYQSKELFDAVSESDNQVGRIVHFLHQSEQYHKTLLVITGTSGVPYLVMSGPGIKNGNTVPAAGLVDIAPTVANIAGLPDRPRSGLILWDAIQANGQQAEIKMLGLRIEDLSKALNEARKEINQTQEEKIVTEKGQSRMVSEKNKILKEIYHRDQQIEQLETRIGFMKYGVILLLLLFFIICLVEYRYLKKKYMIFN